MQVTETLSEGLRRSFNVIVPAAEVESKRAKRLTELSRTLNLPGFRPGKVPVNLVRKRFGGAVTAEVLEESVNTATRRVLEERGLRSATQPKVEVTSLDEARDLEFKVDVELLPDIALPDFSTITLTRLRAEPSIETIDKALGDIAERQVVLEDVAEERDAAPGDVLVVDFEGKMDGTPFTGGAGSDISVELGGSGFIPGFAEQLEGMRPGQQRTIAVTFPENYGVAERAGKAATFDVTAKALKRKLVPELDDELGRKLGFDGLDEVRRLLTGQVQREYDQLSRLRLKRQLLDALAERALFPVPQGMVDGEFEQIWQRLEAERKEGRVDDDDRAKDEATLKQEYRAIAERRVRLGLLLAEIGRINRIVVTPDELTRAMRAEAGRYPGQEQKVMEFFRQNEQAAERLRGPLLEEKVVDYVLQLAQVTDRTVAPEELALEPDVARPAAAAAELTADETTPDTAPADTAPPDAAPEAPAAEDGPGQMSGPDA